MIPTINKPTCVTRNTGTAIYHNITNIVISGFHHRSGVIKTDISDLIEFVFNTCEKVSQKLKHDLFINTSTEKNK